MRLLIAALATVFSAQVVQAGLVLQTDGPYSVAPGHSLEISIYVVDDGVGGPTSLTDFSIKLRLDAVSAVAPGGLQFLDGMPTDYSLDPSYVFAGVTNTPIINVDPTPSTVAPFQETTITDLDTTFDGVTPTGRSLLARIVVTTLPSRNGSLAPPAQPGDRFLLGFDLTYSEFNGGSPFTAPTGSEILVAQAPEPASIIAALTGVLLAGRRFARRQARTVGREPIGEDRRV